MASQLDQAIARRLQRDRQNFEPASSADSTRSTPAEAPDSGARMLDIERVRPNPDQARTAFSPESLAELAASIQRDGQLQPILVRPIQATASASSASAASAASTWGEASSGAGSAEPQQFEIVMGERRWRAAKSIGLAQIRATVREVSDSEMLRLSLVENIQREDLNAVDRARALTQLKAAEPGLRWSDIAAGLGLSRQSISNLVALLKLPQDIQDGVRSGHITEKHARALRQLDGQAQKQLAEQIKSERISGDQALAQARSLRAPATKSENSQGSADSAGTSSGSWERASYVLGAALGHLKRARRALPAAATPAQEQSLRQQIEDARKYLQEIEDALGGGA